MAAAAADPATEYLEIPCKVNIKGALKAGGTVVVGCPWGDTIASFKRRLLDTLGISYVVDVSTVKTLHQGVVLDDASTLMQPKDKGGSTLDAILSNQETPLVCVVPAEPQAPTTTSTGAGAASADHPTDSDESKACGICHEVITDRTRAEIACGHLYCFDCIKEWCAVQNTCPACRQRVPSARRVGGGSSRSSVVRFKHRDREVGSDEELEGAANDDNFVADSDVVCFGMGDDNACKWRNGEFDAKSMSEQLELEAENCSIECDGCDPKRWYHIHCVGFKNRAEVDALGDDDLWFCPICVKSKHSQQQHQRGGEQQQAAVGELKDCAIDLSRSEAAAARTVKGRPKHRDPHAAGAAAMEAAAATATAATASLQGTAHRDLDSRAGGGLRRGSRLKLQLRRPRAGGGPPLVQMPTDTAGGGWGSVSLGAIDSDELSDSSDGVVDYSEKAARVEDDEIDDDGDDVWQPQKRTRGGSRGKRRQPAAAGAAGIATSSDESDTNDESYGSAAGTVALEPTAVMALLREAAGCTSNDTGAGNSGTLTLTLGELERACAKFETFQGEQSVEESEKEVEDMFTLDGRDTVTPISVGDLAAIMARPETGLVEKSRKKTPRGSATASKRKRAGGGTKPRGGSSRGRGISRGSGGRGAAGRS
eukprot:COSAG02_NODE_32_length_50374_cov_46.674013_36_plen_651_part_00